MHSDLDREEAVTNCSSIAHLHGVSLAAVLIAKKRGEDPELAVIAGLLYDLYAYTKEAYDDHARKGADIARVLLVWLIWKM